jgi:phosphoglycerate kinase
MADFYSLEDFDTTGKTVILRVDVNSPINPDTGELLGDTRIRAHLETIRALEGSKLVILAHQSRPGARDFVSLKVHADRLSSLLGRKVRYVDDLFGSSARNTIARMSPGDIILLENVRFYSEEVEIKKYNGEDFIPQAETNIIRNLAPLADYFVCDAFAAAHRSQPSLVGFVEELPSMAGKVMDRELRNLGKALEGAESPSVAILGGAKADDSIAIAKNMLTNRTVDMVLTTGVVANIFLMAKGVDIGTPTREFLRKKFTDLDKLLKDAAEIMKTWPDKLKVPKDVALNNDGERMRVPLSELPIDLPIWDIGLDTIVEFSDYIERAKLIIANGPAGVFETSEFALGTEELFKSMARSEGFSVMGGGETSTVCSILNISREIDHISTGGGACISFLGGKTMPVKIALERSKQLHEEGAYKQ